MPGLASAIVALAVICTAVATSRNVASLDLKRARQQIPRRSYRGHGTLASANAKLNERLASRPGLTLKACEDFTVVELRALLGGVLPFVSDELVSIYPTTDGRTAKYRSLAELEADWRDVPTTDQRVRDGHCHEVVMWFVHHLTSVNQAKFAAAHAIPRLPTLDHIGRGSQSANDVAGVFYASKVTCQACHVGGLDVLDVNESAPVGRRERSRRCYTNYKDLFNITCEPCDGIDGLAIGDDDMFYNQTECLVIATPEAVREADRVRPAFPSAFSVERIGTSDHVGGQTPASPRLYSQSRGRLSADLRGEVWLYRSDVVYGGIFENGVPLPFGNASESFVHAQTAQDRLLDQPGTQVQLKHGMPSWLPAGCSCQTQIVGVPTFPDLQDMQYLGRIRLPRMEFAGDAIELDHWANWFIHVFMDTNASVPHYGQAPSRITDSFAGPAPTGLSVYGKWEIGDPTAFDPTVWSRGLPAVGHDSECANLDGSEACDVISQATFPPRQAMATV